MALGFSQRRQGSIAKLDVPGDTMLSFPVADEGDDSRSHLVEQNLVWGQADEQDAGSRTSNVRSLFRKLQSERRISSEGA